MADQLTAEEALARVRKLYTEANRAYANYAVPSVKGSRQRHGDLTTQLTTAGAEYEAVAAPFKIGDRFDTSVGAGDGLGAILCPPMWGGALVEVVAVRETPQGRLRYKIRRVRKDGTLARTPAIDGFATLTLALWRKVSDADRQA